MTDKSKIIVLVNEKADEIQVVIPFELKDDLKKAFRSAKWDSGNKRWSVAKSAKKRLEAWIHTVEASGALEALKDRSDFELNECETDDLQLRLNAMKATLSLSEDEALRALVLTESRIRLLRAIDALKPQIDIAASAAAKTKAEVEAIERKIEDRLDKIIHVAVMRSAIATMLKEARNMTQIGKERFNNAQAIVADAHEKLAQVGIGSDQLIILINANKNRAYKDFVEWSAPVSFEVTAC